MSYLIKQDEPAGAGVQRVLEEQRVRTHWEANPAVSIHRARQACKRARAVAQVLKPAAPYVATVENAFFRGIQKQVAYTRDNEALVEALDLLMSGVSEPHLVESVGTLRTAFAARAARALEEDQATLRVQIARACDQLREAERRISRLPVAGLRRRDLRRGAGRTWKRCETGILGLGPQSPAADFHRWRRQVKYASNQTRILADIHPVQSGARLRELSTTLGQCQDLELLAALLRDQPDALRIDTHVQRLRRLIHGSLESLRGQSLDLGRRLFQLPEEDPVTELKQNGKAAATGAPQDSGSGARRATSDRDPDSSRRWQPR